MYEEYEVIFKKTTALIIEYKKDNSRKQSASVLLCLFSACKVSAGAFAVLMNWVRQIWQTIVIDLCGEEEEKKDGLEVWAIAISIGLLGGNFFGGIFNFIFFFLVWDSYDLMLFSWLVGPFLASFWLRSRFCWAFAPCYLKNEN